MGEILPPVGAGKVIRCFRPIYWLLNTQEAHRKDLMMGKSKDLSQDRPNLVVQKLSDGNGSHSQNPE